MSKTYRRKNKTWNFNPYQYSFDNGYLHRLPLNKDSQEFKKEKAHFHSDSYNGMGVPHWYVNTFFEKPNRRKTKQELLKWIKNPENYEVLLRKHTKDAGWSYW